MLMPQTGSAFVRAVVGGCDDCSCATIAAPTAVAAVADAMMDPGVGASGMPSDPSPVLPKKTDPSRPAACEAGRLRSSSAIATAYACGQVGAHGKRARKQNFRT
jgi:hypothetical protein